MLFFVKKKRNLFFVATSILFVIFLLPFTIAGVILAFASLLLLILFYPLVIAINLRYYRVTEHFEEAFFAKTPDGTRLAVYYYPATRRRRNSEPVVLCHGLATNHLFFDIDENASLALFLAGKGFDVYAVDQRKIGKSKSSSFESINDNHGFAQLVSDIDSIIKYVLIHQRSKMIASEKVHWVGHSLGAKIMDTFHSKDIRNQKRVARFVSLAGPTRVEVLGHQVVQDLLRFRRFSGIFDIVLLSRWFAPLVGYLRSRYDDFTYNRDAIHLKVLRKFLVNGVSNISLKLQEDLLDYIEGRQKNDDYFKAYQAAMQRIKVPTMLMTGTLDFMCDPYNLSKSFEKMTLPIEKKKLVILGKCDGFRVDYCHGSIALGKYAIEEVYPLINDWLVEAEDTELLVYD